MAFIEYDSGPHAGDRVELNKAKTTFGRQQTCDGVIAHPTVSREHFFIERTGGKFFLVDQGGENGTFVNAERVSWVELRDGDKIQAGPFTLIFKITDERDQAAPALGVEATRPDRSREQDGLRAYDSDHERIYAPEYLKGIDCFNARNYFDAHEVWEEIWLRSAGDTKLFYQMLIQAAVGLHHYERDNYRGARGLYKSVVEKLRRLPSFYMSLDLADFSRQFRDFFAELTEREIDRTLPADKPRPTIRLLGGGTDDYAS
ncbi:MAG TPA: DUF309 domain-containing protein [Blastocatellia bacterium]